MAREIDLSSKLSEDDRNYLLARGREQQVFDNDARFAGEGHVPYIPGFSVDRADGVPADPRTVPPAERESDGDEPEDNYDTWTKDQLEEELENRELPKSGNKAELVARLREDDDTEDDDSDEE